MEMGGRGGELRLWTLFLKEREVMMLYRVE